MKTIVVFSALLAIASASAVYYTSSPLLIRATAIQPAVQQQYHAQDEFGQYAYGYSDPLSAKQEVKTLDGVTRGSYSYRDANGKLQTVDYTADGNGFRVAATNLPKPVEMPKITLAEAPLPVAETPEVYAARLNHLAAIEEAKARAESSHQVQSNALYDNPELPRPVEDTPEVARAKVEHLNAVELVKLRNAAIKESNEISAQSESIITAPAPIIATTSALRYVPSAHIPISLPGGFSYAYGLNGALPTTTRFVSSHFIQQ